MTVSRLLADTKAPNSANPTKQADPMANPLPIAAVVFPTVSRVSVLILAHSLAFDISTMPPALSEIGPYPSIVKATVKVESMPIAAREIPYKEAKLNEIRIQMATHITGMKVDL